MFDARSTGGIEVHLGGRVGVRMLEDGVSPDARPSALQGVNVGGRRERSACVPRNVVADFPQRWVPRCTRKRPLQHLWGGASAAYGEASLDAPTRLAAFQLSLCSLRGINTGIHAKRRSSKHAAKHAHENHQ